MSDKNVSAASGLSELLQKHMKTLWIHPPQPSPSQLGPFSANKHKPEGQVFTATTTRKQTRLLFFQLQNQGLFSSLKFKDLTGSECVKADHLFVCLITPKLADRFRLCCHPGNPSEASSRTDCTTWVSLWKLEQHKLQRAHYYHNHMLLM